MIERQGLIDSSGLAPCVPCALRALRACVVRPAPFLPPLPPWRLWLVWLRVRPRFRERHVGPVGWLGHRLAWGTALCNVSPEWPGKLGGGSRGRGSVQHVVGGGGRGSTRGGRADEARGVGSGSR